MEINFYFFGFTKHFKISLSISLLLDRFSAPRSLPDFDFKQIPSFLHSFVFSLFLCWYLSPLALRSSVAIALATMFS